MSKTFFIDSENVGDNWTQLLDAVDSSDELLVFYTQKSPHMSYRNLIKLKNSPKDVNFIECFEGNNALDFQLVSELGYRLGQGGASGCEYFIVSNDNGFEAAIKYWKRKGFPVRRFNGKACASISTLLKEANETPASAADAAELPVPAAVNAPEVSSSTNIPAPKPQAEEVSNEAVPSEEVSSQNSTAAETILPEVTPAEEEQTVIDVSETETVSDTDATDTDAAQSDIDEAEVDMAEPNPAETDIIETILNTKPEPVTVDDTSKSVYYCIGNDNLANLHEALMQLYGNDKCKVLYNTFKTDPAYRKIPAEYKKMSPEERQQMYCNIVYTMAGFEGTLPDDFAQTVMKAWKNKQNLNSLRAALERRFGKVNGKQSYILIKAHIKILDNIG